MAVLPKEVSQAWEEMDGPLVLTTVSDEGVLNSIYATCVGKYDDETLVVADNYFDKTKSNIKANGKASILFITKGGKSYQIKGTVDYVTDGKVFDFMKSWNPSEHPGHAAAALKVQSVFSGSEKLL